MTSIDTLLQKIFILGTGTAASSADLIWLRALLGPDGTDYGRVRQEIDGYMGSLQAARTPASLFKELALNGVGVVLSDAEASALMAELAGAGIDTWGEIFLYVTNQMQNEYSDVLDNRAEAALEFLDLLGDAQKSSLYQGAGRYYQCG